MEQGTAWFLYFVFIGKSAVILYSTESMHFNQHTCRFYFCSFLDFFCSFSSWFLKIWSTIILHFSFICAIFFLMLRGSLDLFTCCSHKGFLPKFVKRLKDMNFLREDLIFSTHSEKVMLAFAFCLHMGFYLANYAWVINWYYPK